MTHIGKQDLNSPAQSEVDVSADRGPLFPCSVVEFRTEELMKKAVEKVNKHNFNGRPLKVKEVLEVPVNLIQKSR